MKALESGKDKIQQICDQLRKETLEPASQEAREIIENAHMQASEIVSDATTKASNVLKSAEKEMEEKKRVFKASLALAARQGIEQLKQSIEKELFSKELAELVSKEMRDPKIILHILNSLLKGIEEKGIDDELVALIPKEINPRAINEQLSIKVLERLKNKTVVAADFAGGAQLQLKGQKITLDVSDSFIYELVAQYIRKDLRDLIFHV